MRPVSCLVGSIVVLAAVSSWASEWQHTNGPEGRRVNALVAEGSHLYAGSDLGVFRSDDAGTSWVPVNGGLTDLNIRAMASRGTYRFAGTQNGGVFRSADNGATWGAVNTGMSSTNIQAFGVNDAFVFVGTSGGGVCRSSNNGDSWLEVNLLDDGTEMHFKNIFSFGITAEYVFIGTWGGSAFRTADNGTTWYMVTNGMADPRENQIPYAFATNGPYIFAGTAGAGVLRARDSARAWFPASAGLPDSASISALALVNDSLYAATQHGVYRTTNNGDNWLPMSNGLTDSLVFSFAKSGTNLFAGTGNGVWRLPMGEQAVEVARPAARAGVSDERVARLTRDASGVIGYSVGTGETGTLAVYAPSGRMLLTRNVSGEGTATWHSADLPGGICFVRLNTGSTQLTIKTIPSR